MLLGEQGLHLCNKCRSSLLRYSNTISCNSCEWESFNNTCLFLPNRHPVIIRLVLHHNKLPCFFPLQASVCLDLWIYLRSETDGNGSEKPEHDEALWRPLPGEHGSVPLVRFLNGEQNIWFLFPQTAHKIFPGNSLITTCGCKREHVLYLENQHNTSMYKRIKQGSR